MNTTTTINQGQTVRAADARKDTRNMNETLTQCESLLHSEQVAVTAFLQHSDRTDGYDPIRGLLARQAAARLRSIQQALSRLREGHFGECAVCRRPIDTERLIAIPYTDLCIDCQRSTERSSINRLNRSALAAL